MFQGLVTGPAEAIIDEAEKGVVMLNLQFAHLLPEDFDPRSRVWIYQCNRLFMLSEALELETMLQEFVGSWQTHGAPVKGYGNLLFGQFIVLMADETQAGVSGCSTDSSVRLIKEVEKRFKVLMFDRQTLAFVLKNKVQMLPMAQLLYSIEQGFVTGDTLYFNNVVGTKEELERNWLVPVRESWIGKRYPALQQVTN